MINKEVLSEVLLEKVVFIGSIDKNMLHYEVFSVSTVGNVAFREINIYELAHRCKEWAFNQGFIISEINYLFTLGYKFPEFRASIWCILDNHKVLKTQDPETPCMYFDEPRYYEAIFKAGEWIMEQNK